ncbi:vitamin K epoxide reductase family protein [Planomonospora corallina]|uniref:Vitamin K epoxide reductase family protein n=1 Tax=Planomonospora corallina TaxID=1806052 RepID=A0ABV8IDK7_9ACTN
MAPAVPADGTLDGTVNGAADHTADGAADHTVNGAAGDTPDGTSAAPGTAPRADGLLTRLHRLRHSRGWLFGTMLLSACLSLTASFVLSIDAVRLAADPAADLACNINAVISCGTVGSSWQAQLFGFPNAFLGLVAEPVVITIAVASLCGVRFPRAFMLAAQVVYTLGMIFAYWLFYQAMFVIGALCPWCLLVTVSTTLVFSTLTHVNIREGNLFLPRRFQAAAARFVDADLDAMVVVIWLLVLALAVVTKYGAALFG